MTLAYSTTREVSSIGNKYEVRTKLIPDTSYPLGGYTLDKLQLGLVEIDSVVVPNLYQGFGYDYDLINNKLKIGRISSEASFFSVIGDDGLLMSIGNVVGTFAVGETITGGTTGATGVVLEVSTLSGFIRYTPGVGRYDIAEIITGGTSGATAQVFTLPFKRYNLGTDNLVPLCAYDDDTTGRPFSLTNKYGPWVEATTSTIVGTFVNGEAFSIAPGSCTGGVTTVQGGGSVLDLEISTGSLALGSVITGGTSGATAVITSWQWAKVFSKYNNVTPNTVTVIGEIAPPELRFLALGGKLNEFYVGTNVQAILPDVEVIVCGR